MKNYGLKEKLQSRLKDIDSADISDLLRAYFYCFYAFGAILLYAGGLLGLLIAAVVSIPLAYLIFSITNKTGDSLSRLFYGGRKPIWTMQEKFRGILDQVMFLKRQKQFPQALQKVNEILNQEPEFAEALFLKAQILWEGYESANGARRFLNMAKEFVPPEEHLYRWIFVYQERINDEVKAQTYLAENNFQKDRR